MATRRTAAQRKQDRVRINNLIDKGWTVPTIARELGISETTVRRDTTPRPKTPETQKRATTASLRPSSIRAITSKGRVSKPRANAWGGLGALVPPSSQDSFARMFNVIEDWRSLKDPASVMLMLARQSPEVSSAWRTLILMTINGWEAKAMQAGNTDEEDEGASARLNQMLDTIGDRHGSLHNLLSEFVTSAAFRGGMCGEILLKPKTADQVLDLYSVDPAILRFKGIEDDTYGQGWALGQPVANVDGGWIDLDIPTVKYLALDTLPSEPPYGTPIFGTAIMPAIFLLGMFYDIKRVLEKQGFGRLDVTVFPERIIQKLEGAASDDEKFAAVEEYFAAVYDTMDSLGPDDVFLHTDDAEVGRAPGSGGEAGLLAGTDRLIIVMERQLVRALKSMPLLMATTDGVSEANANRQWEIYAEGISNLQQNIENLLSYLLEIGLQAEGIAAKVVFRFSKVRTIDEFREAQTENLKITTAMLAEDRMYMTSDQAAEYAVGHGIPDDLKALKLEKMTAPPPAPIVPAVPADTNPDPGSNRKVIPGTRGVTPEGADAGYAGLPEDAMLSEIDAAIRWWDETVSEGAGLLSADVEEVEA